MISSCKIIVAQHNRDYFSLISYHDMKSNPPLSAAPIAAAPPKSMIYSIISLLAGQSLRIVILRADLSKKRL
jgi:hypothetical protein